MSSATGIIRSTPLTNATAAVLMSPRSADDLVLRDRELPAGLPNEQTDLQEAIHEFFRHRAELSRRRLRELFRRGRTSLAIGICALGGSLAAGNLVELVFSTHIAEILQEGLLIGGWVAMCAELNGCHIQT